MYDSFQEIFNQKWSIITSSQIQYNDKIIEDNFKAAAIFSSHYKNAAMDNIRNLNSDRDFER